MIELLQIAAFNAAYAQTIDSDDLENWPLYFTENCHYRITNVANVAAGLPAGLVWVDSRNMLHDRITSMREANVYERQRYRHIVALPQLLTADATQATTITPFVVIRIMQNGESVVFASGVYKDRFVKDGGKLLLSERVVICDSTVTDTLLVIPL